VVSKVMSMKLTNPISMSSMAVFPILPSMSMEIPSMSSSVDFSVTEPDIFSAGLPLTGSQNSGCSSSLGQIYARAAEYNNMYAVMYSWYMPKDEPSAGLGHRHDWEGVIIWLSSDTDTSEDNSMYFPSESQTLFFHSSPRWLQDSLFSDIRIIDIDIDYSFI
jgi:hypothetical protein